jgi:hypothetical protein
MALHLLDGRWRPDCRIGAHRISFQNSFARYISPRATLRSKIISSRDILTAIFSQSKIENFA